MRFHEFSLKYIEFSKITLFPVQIKESQFFSCGFTSFHKKISNFQRYLKIFRFSKFTFYKVQMWDSSLFIIPSSDVRFKSSCRHSWFFKKTNRIFKVDSFPSSDVRFKSLTYAFIVFHEKYCFFIVHILPSPDVRFKSLSLAFKTFNEKILNY